MTNQAGPAPLQPGGSADRPGRDVDRAPEPLRPRHVVAVAMTRPRQADVSALLDHVVRSSGRATLITGSRGSWRSPLNPAVRVVEVGLLEHRMIYNRLLVHGRWPLLLLYSRVVEAVTRRLGRLLPGAPGRRMRVTAQRHRAKLRQGSAGLWREWTQTDLANHVRPYLLWRALRRHALDELDLASCDLLVWGDRNAWPITWQLSRRMPGVPVRSYAEVADGLTPTG